MAAEAELVQVTHEASSASRIKPTMLHACCVGKLILDETGSSLDQERWVTPLTFQVTYGVNPADCLLTHTYCSDCFTPVMDRIREWPNGVTGS